MKKRLHGCLSKKESDILKIDRVRVGILRCNCYLLDIDNHVLHSLTSGKKAFHCLKYQKGNILYNI